MKTGLEERLKCLRVAVLGHWLVDDPDRVVGVEHGRIVLGDLARERSLEIGVMLELEPVGQHRELVTRELRFVGDSVVVEAGLGRACAEEADRDGDGSHARPVRKPRTTPKPPILLACRVAL